LNTLLLTEKWDLAITPSGDLAVAVGPLAIAQDVASAVRLFHGEAWYNTIIGIPYFQQILGYLPSLQFMKAKFVEAGLMVPGVVSIACFLTGPSRAIREVGGQLQITDDRGVLSVITTPGFGVEPWYVNAADVGINAG
jgi:hypothetical protein